MQTEDDDVEDSISSSDAEEVGAEPSVHISSGQILIINMNKDHRTFCTQFV
jgi:hypothetical protein